MNGQLCFDFNPTGDADGYQAFDAGRDKAMRLVEDRFGLILNQRVRVRIKGWDDEFEGKLVLDQLMIPETRREALRLRIGKVTFDFADLEFCARLE